MQQLLRRISTLSLFLAAACQQDGPITLANNQAPQIRIVQPVLPADTTALVLALGAGELFVASVEDSEDEPESLALAWEAHRTDAVADPLILGAGTADTQGYGEQLVGGLDSGAWEVLARVTDSDGASAEATLPVVVEGEDLPPTATITQPLGGETFLDGATVTLSGVVADDRGVAALSTQWFSNLDGLLDETPPAGAGLVAFSTTTLSVGVHTVTLTATDAATLTAADSVTFEVLPIDQNPTTPVVDVLPDAPTTEADLTCLVTIGSFDPEGAPVTYHYSWWLDGQPTLFDDASLPSSATARGQQWTCEVYASDGWNSSAIGSDSVAIENSAPSFASAIIQPDPAVESSVLTCSGLAYVDVDGDPQGEQVTWTVDGIPVATTPTLDGVAFSRGQSVGCTLEPWDGDLLGAPVVASPITIQNSPPGDPSISLDPSPSAAVSAPLWCQVLTSGFDLDGDTVVDEVRWSVDGAPDPTWDGSFTIPAFEAAWGETWTCEVRSVDGTDASPWVSASTMVVPEPGDLVITEFLADPASVSDAAGEWIELENVRAFPVELAGFELLDDGTDAFTVPGSFVLLPGERAVWARNGDLVTNGGVDADLEYSGFVLDDLADQIVLRFAGVEVDRVEYDLQQVSAAQPGHAVLLDVALGPANAALNDAMGAWCRSSSPIATWIGDFGTPGAPNDPCPCGLSDNDADGWGIDPGCPALDCDDADPTRSPEALEVCGDGIDQDCSGADQLCACESTDGDGDGYGDGPACTLLDCDDAAPLVFPTAIELCNGLDDDCESGIDEGFDIDADGYSTCEGDCADTDGDRHPGRVETCDGIDEDCDFTVDDGFDVDADGFTTCNGDCDDTAPTVHTGASEACDNVDSDCDGSFVDSFPDAEGDLIPDCVDPDDDNDGDPDSSDCADTNAGIHAGAIESCDNLDQDCDGSLVDAFPNFDADLEPDCIDPNDDGDPDPDTTDCDDLNPAIYTGAPESCDNIDSDCDGSLTDGAADFDLDGTPDCQDTNDDGDPDPDTTDCNDIDAAIYTAAPEACDLVDSDCDGSLVDGFGNGDGDSQPDCVDVDDDNDGDPDTTDCNDANAAIYVGAPESCDSIDSDCDLSLVDGATDTDGDLSPDCVDLDDDNDSDPDSTDCNDTNASIRNGATESCDSTDSDCDGSLVDGFTNTDGDTQPDCVDTDDDNDGDPDTTDCNDTNASIRNGATESCDSTDSDCDGSLIDGFSNADGDTQPDCVDTDDDNDGDPDTTDCNDTNAAIRNGATESCDSVDSDCDGSLIDGFANHDTDGQPDCVDTDDDNDGDPDSTDCDDWNPARAHTVSESCNNIDDDCDGAIDDGFDNDGDTWATCENDCNDSSSSVHPAAVDTCDGTDSDCDGTVDQEATGDGWEANNSVGTAAYLAGDDTDVTILPTFHLASDTADWFSINTSDDTNTGCDSFNIHLWMQSIPSGTDYDLYLFDDGGGQLAYSEAFGNTNEEINWSPGCLSWGDDGGTYYVAVVRYSGFACGDSYSLRVQNSQ